MRKLLNVIAIQLLFLSGCANTTDKLQSMWDVATDQPTTPPAVPKKQPSIPVETQKQVFSDDQMVSENRLSIKIKNQLIQAKLMSEKAGGGVHVICPVSATPEILEEIKATGVTYNRNSAMRSGYVVILSRKKQL